MAEDKVEPRDINWRQLLPWTLLFQGFRVALDPNKLVLAAAGILLMAFGWWLLAVIFNGMSPKRDPGFYQMNDYGDAGTPDDVKKDLAWKAFKEERAKWDVMYKLAGPTPGDPYDAGDLADTRDEYERLNKLANQDDFKVPDLAVPHPGVLTPSEVQQLIPAAAGDAAKVWIIRHPIPRPAGALRTLPWDEDRGPNPFMLVTNQAGQQWDKGHFWDWLIFKQLPVLIEPLVKLLSPVIYFFSPKAAPWCGSTRSW